MCVDLHLHSIYSDGTSSPAELIELAAKNKLSAISLTDHDTVDGTAEILALGRSQNLTVFPGLELSTTHRDYSLHILGYGIDHHNSAFKQWLVPLQDGRVERNKKIIAKMRQLGLDVSEAELEAISQYGQAGRPHIARMLVNKGIVPSLSEAFIHYLRKGAPAWAGRFSYTATESIDMIHHAGGIAVLAHPGQLDPELKFLNFLIYELCERGLDGIEAYYPSHSSSVRKRLLQIAKKFNLVVTGGSDYHGKNRKFSSIAANGGPFCPPDSIVQAVEERINLNQNRN